MWRSGTYGVLQQIQRVGDGRTHKKRVVQRLVFENAGLVQNVAGRHADQTISLQTYPHARLQKLVL